jgi:outer membrane lipoprotein-sorting protein
MKMNQINRLKWLWLLVFSAVPFLLPAQNAGDILKKMDLQAASIKDKTANVVMEMINNNTGNVRTRKAVIRQKFPYKTLFRFTYPRSQAGIGTLSLPGGIVYLYMPAFGRPKKISNLANSGTFSQSDFTTEDMGPKNWAKNYTASLLRTTDTTYVLKVIPKGPNSKYTQLLVTVNKQHFFPEKIVYYDLQGKILKEADYQYIRIGNLWTTRVSQMTNYRRNHSTRIINTNIKINQGLKDSEFTIDNLIPKDKDKK